MDACNPVRKPPIIAALIQPDACNNWRTLQIGFEVKKKEPFWGENSFGRLLNLPRQESFFSLPVPKHKEIIPINKVVFCLPIYYFYRFFLHH
jgi:hypothetical protein